MRLKLIDDIWHCDGRGIHDGDVLDMQGDDGQWFPVRIESKRPSYMLDACVTVHGITFRRPSDLARDEFLWPNEDGKS